jgi:uncharacterized protein YlxW (UPF0749 family)
MTLNEQSLLAEVGELTRKNERLAAEIRELTKRLREAKALALQGDADATR